MLLAVLSLCAVGAMPAPAWQEREDFARLLADAGATGTIVVLDEEAKRWHVTNRARAQQGFLPASTFEVFNALVALDAGHVEPALVAADSLAHDALARRTGEPRMRAALGRAGYGNGDLRAGVDRFWREGGFRVTPLEQITLLQHLADATLPFSPRSQDAVTRSMELERGDGWVLRGKTGAPPTLGDGAAGWFVGWVERDERRWFVAVNIDVREPGLAPQRAALARAALAGVGAL